MTIYTNVKHLHSDQLSNHLGYLMFEKNHKPFKNKILTAIFAHSILVLWKKMERIRKQGETSALRTHLSTDGQVAQTDWCLVQPIGLYRFSSPLQWREVKQLLT